MTELKNKIRALLARNETDEAIHLLTPLIEKGATTTCDDDELFYLYGNAWRKKGNWKKALENYLEAMSLNPQSPAKEAHRMLMDILEFYNKDMYNQ